MQIGLSKIGAGSVMIGSRACDAKCPFCISHQTGLPKDMGPINWRNFKKFIMFVNNHQAESILFTGKGEPTLYPDEVSIYLEKLTQFNSQTPIIEMQSNCIRIGNRTMPKNTLFPHCDNYLEEWYHLGLDRIAISAVSLHQEHNRQVYHKDYPLLSETVKEIRAANLQVRICIMMQKGMVDNFRAVESLILWCKENDVQQITFRPIRKADKPEDFSAGDYVDKNGLTNMEYEGIHQETINTLNATPLRRLVHGATIYDIDGQNVCFSDCLTSDPDITDIRTLVFYRDGTIAYDWQYNGAKFL